MKSDDPTCPDYVPSIFRHVDSPKKRKAERSIVQYDRRKDTRKKRIEAGKRQEISEALLLQTTVTCVEDAREQQTEDEQQSDHKEVPAVSVMTDMSMSYILQLEEEVQRLCEENQ